MKPWCMTNQMKSTEPCFYVALELFLKVCKAKLFDIVFLNFELDNIYCNQSRYTKWWLIKPPKILTNFFSHCQACRSIFIEASL